MAEGETTHTFATVARRVTSVPESLILHLFSPLSPLRPDSATPPRLCHSAPTLPLRPDSATPPRLSSLDGMPQSFEEFIASIGQPLPPFLMALSLATSQATGAAPPAVIDLTDESDRGTIDLTAPRRRLPHWGRPLSEDEENPCPGCPGCLGWASADEADADQAYAPRRRVRVRSRAAPWRLRRRDTGQQLAQLPRVDLPAGSECAICLVSEQRTGAVKLQCGHWFHFGCVSQWSRKKCTCPVCRTSFRA